MKRLIAPLVVLCALTAGCGGHTKRSAVSPTTTAPAVVTATTPRCTSGELRALGGRRVSYAGLAPHGARALRRPDGSELARFGAKNVNDYPTVFGVTGEVVDGDCAARWYRVELPIRPNGAIGYVSAASLQVQPVSARIVVDVSERRLRLFERGQVTLTAAVAVGSSATPTPTGRYYVNQRLIPDDPAGPFGPAAIGVSAYSNVLTGWTQGGPIAIHGTDDPASIGHAVSNGCIRLPNATLRKVFSAALAGTPVIITA
ncbi:MAG: L,D-transpeptidase [Actinobacteria bacterium]|nr:L,D-transpeptidase [Actinomycetota bacterium]